VEKQLADGTLVAPFPHDLHSDLAFWLVYPKPRASDPAIQAFRDWLFEQVGQSPQAAGDQPEA
jgi:LysR family glycine cleavage system transcriptional activator